MCWRLQPCFPCRWTASVPPPPVTADGSSTYLKWRSFRSMAKVLALAVPSSARLPPQGAPGGSGRLGTPRAEVRPLGAQPPPRLLERAASEGRASRRISPLLTM